MIQEKGERNLNIGIMKENLQNTLHRKILHKKQVSKQYRRGKINESCGGSEKQKKGPNIS